MKFVPFVLLAFFVGCSRPEVNDCPLSIPDDQLDLGTVWQNSSLERKLTISNNSDRDITIKQFYHSCSCTNLQPDGGIVPANGKLDITLKINLSQSAWKVNDLSEWHDFTGTITPVYEKTDALKQWTLSGRVHIPIVPNPLSVNFGSNSEHATFPITVPLEITSLAVIKTIRMASLSRYVETGPIQRVSNTKFTTSVYLKKAPEGLIDGAIQLTPILEDDTEAPAISIPINGLITSDIELSPPNCITIGTNAIEDVITYKSMTGRKVIFVSVDQQPGLKVSKLSDMDAVRLSFKPANDKMKYVVFRFSNDGKVVEKKLPILYQ